MYSLALTLSSSTFEKERFARVKMLVTPLFCWEFSGLIWRGNRNKTPFWHLAVQFTMYFDVFLTANETITGREITSLELQNI